MYEYCDFSITLLYKDTRVHPKSLREPTCIVIEMSGGVEVVGWRGVWPQGFLPIQGGAKKVA